MVKPTRVYLVGPMGAGKTTIGRQLAHTLALAFEDADQEIQSRTGVDIPTIFEFEGEAGFRKREKQVIDDLTQKDGIVLATGGGAVIDEDNRNNLSARGLVIYLECSPQQQYDRTYKDRNRPLLETGDPLETLTALMDERDPLYKETSDITVSTESRSAAAVVKDIVDKLNLPGS